MNVFAVRAAEQADARPAVAAAVEPLLKAREAVGRQIQLFASLRRSTTPRASRGREVSEPMPD